MLSSFIISLGSNLSFDEAHSKITKAETFLSDFFEGQISFSAHYETEGIGSGVGKMYVNSVAKGQTSLSADDIRQALKEYERNMGRTPEAKAQGIVPIDLDLLTIGNIILKPKDLQQEYVLRGLRELESI